MLLARSVSIARSQVDAAFFTYAGAKSAGVQRSGPGGAVSKCAIPVGGGRFVSNTDTLIDITTVDVMLRNLEERYFLPGLRAPTADDVAAVVADIHKLDCGSLTACTREGAHTDAGSVQWYVGQTLELARRLSESADIWKVWHGADLPTATQLTQPYGRNWDAPRADFAFTHKREGCVNAMNALLPVEVERVGSIQDAVAPVFQQMFSRFRIARGALLAGQSMAMFGLAMDGKRVMLCRAVFAKDVHGCESLTLARSDALSTWQSSAGSCIPKGLEVIARVLRLDLDGLALRERTVPPPFTVTRVAGERDEVRIEAQCVLGIGGYSAAWRATMTSSGGEPISDVVVKTPLVQARSDLAEEAAILEELNRPETRSIPRLIGTVKEGVVVKYSVTTPVGVPVEHVAIGAARRRAFALHVVRGVLDALEVAHEHGFVHCDVRPANVVLCPLTVDDGGGTWQSTMPAADDGGVPVLPAWHAVLVDWGLAAPVGTSRHSLHGVGAYVHAAILDCDASLTGARRAGKGGYLVGVEHDLLSVVFLLFALRYPTNLLPWERIDAARCIVGARSRCLAAMSAEGATAWNRALAGPVRRVEGSGDGGCDTGITAVAGLRAAIEAMAPLGDAADEDADLLPVVDGGGRR